MDEERYLLSVTRLEVCDLMLACTEIVIGCKEEMENDRSCPEFRRTQVLPNTAKKWQRLHDKLERSFTFWMRSTKRRMRDEAPQA